MPRLASWSMIQIYGGCLVIGESIGLGGEVPLLLGGSGWDRRRRLGWQADPLQIAPDRCGVLPRSDQTQVSAKGGAGGDVEGKDARQWRRPKEVDGAPAAERVSPQAPKRPWRWARPGSGRGHWAPGCHDNATSPSVHRAGQP
jgi:hypothetical protein